MSLVLLVSRADAASVNIGRALLERRDWKKAGEFQGLPVHEAEGDLLLVEIEHLHIHAENVDAELKEAGFGVDGLVVASRHKAASGSPSLTVHPIGNFRDAGFGGRPGHLVPAMPAFMGHCLRALHERAKRMRHAVTFEATHHGPALNVPTCFVEIGSSEESWENETLGDLVAGAILEAAAKPPVEEAGAPNLVAVGGSHYAPRATDLVRKRKACIGHVLPGYHIDAGVDARAVLDAVHATPAAAGYFLDERGYDGKNLPPILQAFTGLEFGRFTADDLEPR